MSDYEWNSPENDRENMTPENMEPENMTPENMVQEDMEPDNMTRENMTQENMTPENMTPENSYVGDTYGEYRLGRDYFSDMGNMGNMGNMSSKAPEKKKSFWKKFGTAAACALVFGVVASASFSGTKYLTDILTQSKSESLQVDQVNSTGTSIEGTKVVATTSSLDTAEDRSSQTVVGVVDKNLSSVVAINSTFVSNYVVWGRTYSETTTGSGSGFIVGENDTSLLIATNNHVIENAQSITVTFIDGKVVNATVKGSDTIADLAIVAVKFDDIEESTRNAISVAKLGNSDDVSLGEMVIAIGNALGYGQSVTVGYVSAKERTVNVDGNEMLLLQTDAAINQGNSGGPLFNTEGEVIGINSVKYADTSVEGMCFAIPISRAVPILDELIKREVLSDEEKGYLGITVMNVDPNDHENYQTPTDCVYVKEVSEGSAAEAAGIYNGDFITAVNGVKVTTSTELVAMVTGYRYGTSIEVTLLRYVDGEFKEITVTAVLQQSAAYAK